MISDPMKLQIAKTYKLSRKYNLLSNSPHFIYIIMFLSGRFFAPQQVTKIEDDRQEDDDRQSFVKSKLIPQRA